MKYYDYQFDEIMPENRRIWLITWNPKKWNWKGYEQFCKESKVGKKITEKWTCNSKQPAVDDELFLLKQGDEPRGIIAHGKVVKTSYQAPKYDEEKASKGEKSNHIDVEFDRIQNYKTEKILLQNELKQMIPEQQWSSLGSGIEIKSDSRQKIKKIWMELLNPSKNDSISIVEQFREVLNDVSIGTKFKRQEIIDKIVSRYGTNPHSIIPSDYCYNMKNAGISEKHVSFFMHLDTALYEYLGEDYEYMDTQISSKKEYPKNMILYGPPGTGKTYNTVLYAVSIIDGISLETLEDKPYEDVHERYEELRKQERIAFTTFHQSYGYEEFIEGIKPDLDKDRGSISYKIEDGSFKKFCLKAKKSPELLAIDAEAKVWFVRLNTDRGNELKQWCFSNNEIRFGYDSEDCWVGNKLKEVKAGDYVISHEEKGIFIDAIGIVKNAECVVNTYDSEGAPTSITDQYPWRMNVEWLAKDIHEDVKSINGDTYLPNFEIVEMKRMRPSDLLDIVNRINDVEGHKTEMRPYVFIIDEINRGNISKIFGELITLIEETKRDGASEVIRAILPYSKESFSVPQNVYILGTMNTADRSIALMDTALRRRFEFIEMMPKPAILKKIGANLVKDGNETIDVEKMLEFINERITFLYDREHTIGHAFFTGLKANPDINHLASIFEKNVIPLLQEYFYEDYGKIQLVLGDNKKDKDEYKFILDEPVKSKDIFNGSPDVDLPEKKYTIQKAAFFDIQSYKQIGQGI